MIFSICNKHASLTAKIGKSMIFSICNKHASLTAKIGKQMKKSFVGSTTDAHVAFIPF